MLWRGGSHIRPDSSSGYVIIQQQDFWTFCLELSRSPLPFFFSSKIRRLIYLHHRSVLAQIVRFWDFCTFWYYLTTSALIVVALSRLGYKCPRFADGIRFSLEQWSTLKSRWPLRMEILICNWKLTVEASSLSPASVTDWCGPSSHIFKLLVHLWTTPCWLGFLLDCFLTSLVFWMG